MQAEDIVSGNRTTAEILEESASITTKLVAATETSGISLLPTELNATNTILSKVIDVLEDSVSTGSAPPIEVHSKMFTHSLIMMNCILYPLSLQAIVDVLSNTLEETNLNGWSDLQVASFN